MARKRSKKRRGGQDEQQVDLLANIGQDPPREDDAGAGSGSQARTGHPAGTGSSLDQQADERPKEPVERASTPPWGSDTTQPAAKLPETPQRPEASDVTPVPKRVRSPGEALARAKEMVELGKISEAIELYRDIVETSPQSLKARNNLGALLDGLGEHELALVHFEAAEEIDPDSVEVLTNLGSTLGALSRYEEAEQKLLAALRLAPEDFALRAAFGVLAFRRGMYAQAVQELTWVCERDPDGNNQYYLGESLNRLGRYDEAIEPLEQATRLRPADARAFYTLGHLYDRKHLPEAAAEMYRRARELQGG